MIFNLLSSLRSNNDYLACDTSADKSAEAQQAERIPRTEQKRKSDEISSLYFCGERGIGYFAPYSRFALRLSPASPAGSLQKSALRKELINQPLFAFVTTPHKQVCVPQYQKQKKMSIISTSPCFALFLRREGDSNPRNPFGVYSLSRRASSTTPASLLFFATTKIVFFAKFHNKNWHTMINLLNLQRTTSNNFNYDST